MVLAGTPLTGAGVPFEVPVPGAPRRRPRCVVGERSAAEVRVQHHARRVDRPAHRGAQGGTDVGGEPAAPVRRSRRSASAARTASTTWPRAWLLEQLRDTRLGQGGVDGGQRPTRVAHRAPGPGRRPTRPRRPRRCIRFQIGARTLSSSITYRHAANAAGRCGAEQATATLGSPTATRPVRCTARHGRTESRAGLAGDGGELAEGELLVGVVLDRDDLAGSPSSRRMQPRKLATPPCSGSPTAAVTAAMSRGSGERPVIRRSRAARGPPRHRRAVRHRAGSIRG